MIKLIKYLVLCVLVFIPIEVQAAQITDSVVKIFTTANPRDFYRPWQSKGIMASGGSGSIIEGNKILTNAHVVSDYTFIQVKKDGDSKKYTARVEAIGHECDLALLVVDDPQFFKGVKPLEFGVLPKLQDTVSVFGYPKGGGKLSITEGVVSRVEVTAYSQSSRNLLTVQIDAAINPGNSGGPVIQDGKIVGVAMQVLQTGQSIGYMIPMPVIQHFFKDLKDDKFDGFPLLGIDYVSTENKALRTYYKINQKEGGVLVTGILPFSSAENILKKGDTIFSINGVEIGEDGTFKFRDNERLTLSHLITQKQVNDVISIEISRDGKFSSEKIKLTSFRTLVPYPKYYDTPTYYIYGGLVFTILSTDFMASWGNYWDKAPLDYRYYLMGHGRRNKERNEDLVVLLSVLSDDINVGYHGVNNALVEKVNGQQIKSFKDLVKALDKVKDSEEYTIIETENANTLIMDNTNIENINMRILKRNNIGSAYSENVKEWLKK